MHNEKRSYFKRTLVMLMAVMMVFTYMPSTAWAGAEDGTTQTPTESGDDTNANGEKKYLEDIIFYTDAARSSSCTITPPLTRTHTNTPS